MIKGDFVGLQGSPIAILEHDAEQAQDPPYIRLGFREVLGCR